MLNTILYECQIDEIILPLLFHRAFLSIVAVFLCLGTGIDMYQTYYGTEMMEATKESLMVVKSGSQSLPT